jgi:hypothetical protein
MRIEADLYSVLSVLVSNRVYPDEFPQNVVWPAIRYLFISVVPGVTICGSGNDPESDFRIQLDIVAKTGSERDALRISIQGAMRAFENPAVLEFWSKEYDAETKTYRAQMDYMVEPSSSGLGDSDSEYAYDYAPEYA